MLAADQLGPDFNRDTYPDLVIGLPLQDVGSVTKAGAALVQYGSSGGIAQLGQRQLLSQSLFGRLSYTESAYDNFGDAFAYGDFDRDGCDDLAVGIPNENSGGASDSGAVMIFYGSPTWACLSSGRTQWLTQDGLFGPGSSEAGDHFGNALAAGDFNRDGYADLAVGVGDEDVGSTVDGGSVNIIYGSAKGLDPLFIDPVFFWPPFKVWTQESDGVSGDSEQGDRFGAALAAGDFNGDGADDLAIGTPGETREEWLSNDYDIGSVRVVFGYPHVGLSKLARDPATIDGTQDYARIGSVLAAGNFNGDGFDDLAIGIPLRDVGSQDDAGAVYVAYGSLNGFPGRALFTQPDAMVEAGDQFGYSLAVGDFNGDRTDDLAVGAPYEDIGTVADAGAVSVLYGSPLGIEVPRAKTFYQGVAGLPGTAQASDHFGLALAAGDYHRAGSSVGFADLVVGVPGETVGALQNAGAIQVVYGASLGLTEGGQRFLTQDDLAVEVEVPVIFDFTTRKRYAARAGNYLGWRLG